MSPRSPFSSPSSQRRCSCPAARGPKTPSPKPNPRSQAGIDRYGDPLPEGAVVRLGTVRYRYPGWENRIAFIPGGETIVMGVFNDTLRFFDARTGKVLRKIHLGKARAQAFDVAADGKTIATLASRQIGESREYETQLSLWDVTSGDLRSRLKWVEPSSRCSQCLCFAPDGKSIATGASDGKLRLWDIASGTELLNYAPIKGGIIELAISPDGEKVAVASFEEAVVWDWLKETKPKKLAGLDHRVEALAFSPDGKWLAITGRLGGAAYLFDVATNRLAKRLKLPTDRYVSIKRPAFDPTSSLLTVPTRTQGIELWDLASGKRVQSLAAPRVLNWDNVAISSDGKLLTAIAGSSLFRVWDLRTGKPMGDEFVGHSQSPSEIEFTADGKTVVSGDETGVIRRWVADTGAPLAKIDQEAWVAALKASPDGQRIVSISAALDNTIRVWDAKTGRQVFKLFGHGRLGGKRQLAIAPDGKTFASFGPDLYLRLWDMGAGKALQEHAIRPPGMTVNLDEDGEVLTYNGTRMNGPEQVSRKSRFSADAKMLLLPSSGKLHVFDVRSGKLLRAFRPGGVEFEAFALSPNGKWLATIQSKPLAEGVAGAPPAPKCDLRIIDFATNKVVVRREIDGGSFSKLCFSPGSRLLAKIGSKTQSFRDGGISLWDVEAGREFAWIPVECSEIAFSPDGERIAAGQLDSSILIWEIAKFRLRKGKTPKQRHPSGANNTPKNK